MRARRQYRLRCVHRWRFSVVVRYLGKLTTYTEAWLLNAATIQFAAGPGFVDQADLVLDEIALYPHKITDAEVLTLAQRQISDPACGGGYCLGGRRGDDRAASAGARQRHLHGLASITITTALSGGGAGDNIAVVAASGATPAFVNYNSVGDVAVDTRSASPTRLPTGSAHRRL